MLGLEDPASAVRALRRVAREGASVEEAMEELKDFEGGLRPNPGGFPMLAMEQGSKKLYPPN